MEPAIEENSKDKEVQSSEATSSSQEFIICKPDSGSGNSMSPTSNPFLSTPKNSSFSLRSSSLNQAVSSGNSANDGGSKTFVLNPPRLSNPFFKSSDEDKEVKDAEANSSRDKAEEKPNSTEKTSSSREAVSFVPLGWSQQNTASSSRVSSTPTFVFGQNLRDKVEGPKSNETEVSSTTTDSHQHDNNVEEPKANGTTSEMLFSSAVKSESAEVKTCEGGKTLSEAAREYEEARSVKRKFEPVQLITGEEHEQNVLQMNCKLFAYDKVSAGWQERGRSYLRLNDSTPTSSRLIIRAHGSLRVLINTQVWSGMVVQRASPKSLRITAMDNSGSVKVFLVSASQTEVDELQRYLELRLKRLERSNSQDSNKKLRPDDSS